MPAGALDQADLARFPTIKQSLSQSMPMVSSGCGHSHTSLADETLGVGFGRLCGIRYIWDNPLLRDSLISG